MKSCKFCGGDMEAVYGSDYPEIGIAFTLYECGKCLAILRKDVWKHKGERWIAPQYDELQE